MTITAEEARNIATRRDEDEQRKKESQREKSQGGARNWAAKKFPKKMKSISKALKRAAGMGRAFEVIDLRVVNDEQREVLLADLVVKELKKRGFDVLSHEREEHNHTCMSDYCTGDKVRRYCVVWGSHTAVPIEFKHMR